MSELDLIFSRKKTSSPSEEEKKNENATSEEKKEEPQLSSTPIQLQQTTKQETTGNSYAPDVEEIMKKFINKDPKIGVWSYQSYLLLQYLYNTVPGFKMSRVAKEALERGLREMYPDLFKLAEKVARESGKL